MDVVHRQRAPVDHVKHAPRRAWSGLRSGQGQGQGQRPGSGFGSGSGSAPGSGEGSSVPTTSWTPERSLSMSWRTFVPPMQACRAGGGRGSRASASSAAPRTDRRVSDGAAQPQPRLARCNAVGACVRACVRACVAAAPCAVPALTGRRKRATTPGFPRAATVGATGASRRERGGGAGRPGVRGVARTMVDTPR